MPSDDAGEPDTPQRRAGIVIESLLGRHFVPAEQARKLSPRPTVTPVPGAEFGMALLSGQVVAVIEMGGSPSSSLLVCEAHGQLLALSGAVAKRSGFFAAAPGGVLVEAVFVADLDIGAIARSVSRKLGGAPVEEEPAP